MRASNEFKASSKQFFGNVRQLREQREAAEQVYKAKNSNSGSNADEQT
jgi:hypothetical protein